MTVLNNSQVTSIVNKGQIVLGCIAEDHIISNAGEVPSIITPCPMTDRTVILSEDAVNNGVPIWNSTANLWETVVLPDSIGYSEGLFNARPLASTVSNGDIFAATNVKRNFIKLANNTWQPVDKELGIFNVSDYATLQECVDAAVAYADGTADYSAVVRFNTGLYPVSGSTPNVTVNNTSTVKLVFQGYGRIYDEGGYVNVNLTFSGTGDVTVILKDISWANSIVCNSAPFNLYMYNASYQGLSRNYTNLNLTMYNSIIDASTINTSGNLSIKGFGTHLGSTEFSSAGSLSVSIQFCTHYFSRPNKYIFTALNQYNGGTIEINGLSGGIGSKPNLFYGATSYLVVSNVKTEATSQSGIPFIELIGGGDYISVQNNIVNYVSGFIKQSNSFVPSIINISNNIIINADTIISTNYLNSLHNAATGVIIGNVSKSTISHTHFLSIPAGNTIKAAFNTSGFTTAFSTNAVAISTANS